jgi:hypothetical protein
MSDPEELLSALDDAEVIGTVRDALGDFVKVGVLGSAVLIGVSGSPAILDTPQTREEFERLWMEARQLADAAEAEPREPAAPSLSGRVTATLTAAGFTDSREVFPGGFLVTGGAGSVTVQVPWTDTPDGERMSRLAAFADALRAGGLQVTRPKYARYLIVRARPGEGRS